jgi:hypothetical protein
MYLDRLLRNLKLAVPSELAFAKLSYQEKVQ